MCGCGAYPRWQQLCLSRIVCSVLDNGISFKVSFFTMIAGHMDF